MSHRRLQSRSRSRSRSPGMSPRINKREHHDVTYQSNNNPCGTGWIYYLQSYQKLGHSGDSAGHDYNRTSFEFQVVESSNEEEPHDITISLLHDVTLDCTANYEMDSDDLQSDDDGEEEEKEIPNEIDESEVFDKGTMIKLRPAMTEKDLRLSSYEVLDYEDDKLVHAVSRLDFQNAIIMETKRKKHIQKILESSASIPSDLVHIIEGYDKQDVNVISAFAESEVVRAIVVDLNKDL